jgi:hypothetical protein
MQNIGPEAGKIENIWRENVFAARQCEVGIQPRNEGPNLLIVRMIGHQGGNILEAGRIAVLQTLRFLTHPSRILPGISQPVEEPKKHYVQQSKEAHPAILSPQFPRKGAAPVSQKNDSDQGKRVRQPTRDPLAVDGVIFVADQNH